MSIKRTVNRPPPSIVLDREAVGFVAQRALTRIRVRTFDKGRGRDGQELPAYSPAYAAKRGKQGLRVTPPDYTITGRLRRSTRVVSIKKISGGWRISIGPTGHRIIVGARLNRRGAGWLGETADEQRKTQADIRTAADLASQRSRR